MTERIDLDDMAVEEKAEDPDGNYGDWLWRGEGDPDDEPSPGWTDGDTEATSESEESTGGGPDRQAAPGVPSTGGGGPVGVPEDRGGAGGGTSGSAAENTPGGGIEQAGTAETHDVDIDDMTMALTYKAAHHFTEPQRVFAEAREWADWVGVVGEVSTPAIRKFQREAGVELDFFGGSESGPDERLADIDAESMFYAERMVVVGVDGDEWIADAADWEFVPLEHAAEKADWELKEEFLD
ncbi:uncharacterized protein NP_4966A [Natronomonas pharaonis DSM 2160]|uniref:DUF7124 domain-containing protein n=1 Tax=Natronomonas pharaonis (strain ATCC 35678 / DSM 2160 / CIP 103997 / JCM 8858 / NBRC 14720 / NCIMB 2260 / Gabara) TaxID=348780 RepID=A0A1U7EZ76_NATPD|nr:hypothetical protein [Natronomonas pharaonis]CAI50574.1 uncharacterized protein NP_4966A [Natronomonas pharaonis DSM 2160]